MSSLRTSRNSGATGPPPPPPSSSSGQGADSEGSGWADPLVPPGLAPFTSGLGDGLANSDLLLSGTSHSTTLNVNSPTQVYHAPIWMDIPVPLLRLVFGDLLRHRGWAS
ncbi:hypothetical protein FA15DRAFT_711784 [Coprinopsis marcescibilis]|uniref:Uncharacterized protein n=1 Tax=Coprinopsis marcescibilis TaxID=230819 RepID=A0A5C3K9C7_COPMA|nr:hypothetical protein FA15DRAFT_711784 [Coprinopsis marcescibilis]